MTAAPPPIAFLPGATGDASAWQPVADRLPGREHLLIGYPGFAGNPPDPAIWSLSDLYRALLARLPAVFDLVAQSMGGVLALRMALEQPDRIRRLVLVATSGGMDVQGLGGVDWREGWRAAHQKAPTWFIDDRTDVTGQLAYVRAPTLLIFGDTDPISPVRVGELLRDRLPRARLEIIAGATHDMELERPDVVAGLIRSHLGEL
jgi:pimeloyl-ACP methyl ester carboxylesterase